MFPECCVIMASGLDLCTGDLANSNSNNSSSNSRKSNSSSRNSNSSMNSSSNSSNSIGSSNNIINSSSNNSSNSSNNSIDTCEDDKLRTAQDLLLNFMNRNEPLLNENSGQLPYSLGKRRFRSHVFPVSQFKSESVPLKLKELKKDVEFAREISNFVDLQIVGYSGCPSTEKVRKLKWKWSAFETARTEQTKQAEREKDEKLKSRPKSKISKSKKTRGVQRPQSEDKPGVKFELARPKSILLVEFVYLTKRRVPHKGRSFKLCEKNEKGKLHHKVKKSSPRQMIDGDGLNNSQNGLDYIQLGDILGLYNEMESECEMEYCDYSSTSLSTDSGHVSKEGHKTRTEVVNILDFCTEENVKKGSAKRTRKGKELVDKNMDGEIDLQTEMQSLFGQGDGITSHHPSLQQSDQVIQCCHTTQQSNDFSHGDCVTSLQSNDPSPQQSNRVIQRPRMTEQSNDLSQVKYVTSKQSHDFKPQQSHDFKPQQSDDVSPQESHDVSPQPSDDVSPQESDDVSPQESDPVIQRPRMTELPLDPRGNCKKETYLRKALDSSDQFDLPVTLQFHVHDLTSSNADPGTFHPEPPSIPTAADTQSDVKNSTFNLVFDRVFWNFSVVSFGNCDPPCFVADLYETPDSPRSKYSLLGKGGRGSNTWLVALKDKTGLHDAYETYCLLNKALYTYDEKQTFSLKELLEIILQRIAQVEPLYTVDPVHKIKPLKYTASGLHWDKRFSDYSVCCLDDAYSMLTKGIGLSIGNTHWRSQNGPNCKDQNGPSCEDQNGNEDQNGPSFENENGPSSRDQNGHKNPHGPSCEDQNGPICEDQNGSSSQDQNGPSCKDQNGPSCEDQNHTSSEDQNGPEDPNGPECKTTECDVCLEPVEELGVGGSRSMVTLSPCLHSFCLTCWRRHAYTSYCQGKAHVSCLVPNCSNFANPAMVLSLLSGPFFSRWRQRYRDTFLEQSPFAAFCPACPKVVILTRNTDWTSCFPVSCHCGERFCHGCGEKPHWPATCQQIEAFKSSAVFHELSKVAGNPVYALRVRPCGHCAYPIDKVGGCNEVYCVKCSHHFSWTECERDEKKLFLKTDLVINYRDEVLHNLLTSAICFESLLRISTLERQWWRHDLIRSKYWAGALEEDEEEKQVMAVTQSCREFLMHSFAVCRGFFLAISIYKRDEHNRTDSVARKDQLAQVEQNLQKLLAISKRIETNILTVDSAESILSGQRWMNRLVMKGEKSLEKLMHTAVGIDFWPEEKIDYAWIRDAPSVLENYVSFKRSQCFRKV